MKSPVIGLLLLAAGVVMSAGCTSFNASTKNAQGVDLFRYARYAEAQREFEQAATMDPTNADAHYNMASVYHKMAELYPGQPEYWKYAEEAYHKCLDRDANHVPCHRALAVLLVQTGRFDRATYFLDNWARNNPTWAEPLVQAAWLQHEAGQLDAALQYLTRATALAPNDARVWAATALIREQRGDTDQAISNLQQSLALRPNQPILYDRLAALRLKSLTGQPAQDVSSVAANTPTVPSTQPSPAPPTFFQQGPPNLTPSPITVQPLTATRPGWGRSSFNGMGSHRY